MSEPIRVIGVSGTPCRVCNVPHEWNQARGWRANNGHGWHAYDKRPETEQPSGTHQGGALRPGFTTAVFGGFYRCDTCAALLDRNDADLDIHAAYHKGVLEGLAVAWQLLNDHGGNAA